MAMSLPMVVGLPVAMGLPVAVGPAMAVVLSRDHLIPEAVGHSAANFWCSKR